ncbi:DUF4129 domain-containing protein [Microbacterium hominis]|uniref:DUF4129 domain-containing protein n=1 Tax=Microbacterium hominis TaxID=162426 RepID=A0A7D4QJQ0_9MICO|nr:DUF4129 domain-containing protein [Microbacterium hominis]QKJ19996.1 DUF4129 domain-containing protein [Microbacterium hominis]
MAGLLRMTSGVPPLTPDGEQGRDWAERELSDPRYEAAQPTLFDRIARAIGEFFENLFSSQLPADWGPTLALIAAVVVVAVIVAAVVVWGLPRATRRAPASLGSLFDDADERSAAELRRDAQAHAAREEWTPAIVLRFRALARAVHERGIVDTPPGTTAHGFARAAAAPFPAHAAAIEQAAGAFDDVRYLRRPGTAAAYERVAAADASVQAARPRIADEVGV